MRAIPGDFDPGSVAAIDGRLAAVAQDEGAAILLAIESGSRAWGFPSPDSDYDCRFLFVRAELGKALKLLLKGNAVVIEWLMSPIVYAGDPAFRADMLALARDHADAHRIARHYLHLGVRQRRTYFADGKAVKLKKIFYALRPAAALRWLRLRPDQAIAPMHFPTLMAECEPPTELAALVDDLIARKAVSRELGETPLPLPVERFIDSEFAIAEAAPPRRTSLSPDARAAAEALFRKWVRA